jgi:hypothetical protein
MQMMAVQLSFSHCQRSTFPGRIRSIRVEVPTAAGTGQFEVNTGTTATSPSILTVDYAHLNVDFDPGSARLLIKRTILMIMVPAVIHGK